jgi:DNA-binding response OmpR family regulator
MAKVDVLVVIPREDASRYHKNLSSHEDFRVQIASNTADALRTLEDSDKHVDTLVVENRIDGVFDFIGDLRHTYPRLLIILIDEEADFGLPGQADEISTAPFENDDLARRISRLMSDRQLETLRADSLPAVRDFAKRLRKASGEIGKQQAAVLALMDMDYDYVAFYRLEQAEPLRLVLKAQDGQDAIQSIAPEFAAENDIMAWVSVNGQSRTAGPGDSPTHPLVNTGRLAAVVCVPVHFSNNRYGVLVACRTEPDSITQENVLMLELVSNQLAAAISKEIVN